MEKLNEMSAKMNRIERHLAELDAKVSDNFDITQEQNLIQVFFIFLILIN